MSPAATLARHGAGCIEPIWVGLRHGLRHEGGAAPEGAGLPVPLRRDFRTGTTRLGALALEVSVETRGADAWLTLRARNEGPDPVPLDALAVGLRWEEPGIGSALRYLRNGWQSWSFTGSRELDAAGTPDFPSGPWLRAFHHARGAVPPDRAGWHESDLVMVVGAAGGGPAALVGAFERGSAFAVLYARRAAGTVEIEAELIVDAVLAPGAETAPETLRVALGRDASELLERYAQDYGRRAQARVSRPFVAGWCSWYYAFHDVREDDVLRNLDGLLAARDELPIDVVQLDDGYQRAIGDWLETNEKFPRGLAPLAQAIRDAGFAPGLWTAPFCVTRESRLFEAGQDWLLRKDGRLLPMLIHPAWAADGLVFGLDASRPEVQAHLGTLFRELVGMGFGYLKLDFLFAAAHPADPWDPGLPRAARLRRGLEAIRAGAGEEAFLLGCGCPLGAAVGVVDGMRIGPDVAPHWAPDPARAIPGIEETLPSTRSAVRSVLNRAWMHRRLWLNDPDCLMVRSQDTALSAAEREALAAAVAVTGGTCVFSDDLPRLCEADRTLLADTLTHARAVDTAALPGLARVEGLLAREIPQRVLADDGAGVYEALLNPDDAPRSFAIAGDGSAQRCIGAVPRGSLLESPPHGGTLLRREHCTPLAVFCDFDGTFSMQDVGATLAQRYAPERRPAAWARFERGEITAWQYNLEILDGLPVPLHELEAFLEGVALDPGARALLAFCEERGVPFRILSDGFDWNLNRLQAIHDVRFAYTANRLRYEDGRWRIRSGHSNPDCGCGTGICKSGVIAEYRRRHPQARVVHVGNGRVSDTCGALAADAAFAKDSLATELQRRGVAFEPFRTLHDVIPALARMLGEGQAAAR